MFLAVLLLASGVGDESMEALLQKLRSDDSSVRTAAADDLLAGWSRWKETDLSTLEEASRDPDPEVSGRAGELRARIRIRRSLGANLLSRLPKSDEAFTLGDDAAKLSVLREARGIWKSGQLHKEDMAGLELVATRARWTDPNALDRFLNQPDSGLTFSVPGDREARTRVRIKEVEGLGTEGKQRAGQVAEYLGDYAPEVRTSALKVIGGLQARDQAPSVARMLRDQNAGVRSEALALLGSWGSREYTAEFTRMLEDPSGQVRRRAAEALGAWGQQDAGARISKLLKDPFGPTRAEAAAVLGAFGAREYAGDVAPLLRDPQPLVRRNAAYAIGRFGEPLLAGALKELLKDGDPEVRATAAQSLGQLEPGLYADEVSTLLRDLNPDVREEAAWVLGFAATRAGARHVTQLLEDRDPAVREGAVRALGRMRARDARAAVVALLDDPSSWVRSEAVLAMARLGGRDDAPALAAKLRDPDRKVRVNAALALGELGAGDPQGALAGLERDADRLLGLSSTFSLARLEKAGPAAQGSAIREVDSNDLAFACLSTVASDAESFVHAREAWEILQRPLVLRRSIETWADLSAALSEVGLGLEVQTDCMIGRLDKGAALSGRDALDWLLGRFAAPVVVLDGRKIRLMSRRDAVVFWKTRLDRK